MIEYALVLYALTLWREAQNQNDATIIAIAWSIKNRVHSPRWWGKNLVEVLTKKFQYSSMTNPGDVNLIKWPQEGDAVFTRCCNIADEVMKSTGPDPVSGATHYYDKSEVKDPPDWAAKIPFVIQVGDFFFHIEK